MMRELRLIGMRFHNKDSAGDNQAVKAQFNRRDAKLQSAPPPRVAHQDPRIFWRILPSIDQ
jgi:hypothetical protein